MPGTDNQEVLRATGRFGIHNRQYQAVLKVTRQRPEREWAVESANGIGRPVRVLDVPAKLAAPARVFDTGQAC